MAFVSSLNNNTSNTNEAVNTAHGVSTASTQVNAANSSNIDNLSDAVICNLVRGVPSSNFIKIDHPVLLVKGKKEMLTEPSCSRGPELTNTQEQVKYVPTCCRFTEVKTASTPMETQKPLPMDEDGKEVDVHMYRSMIGSLMYLTSSIPDIIFVVCCKKHIVVSNFTTEAEYVAPSSCSGQVLWIQNQLLDYG
ncbi:hypothetical protein Tco_1570537, partial [Tanacetum coccineum]